MREEFKEQPPSSGRRSLWRSLVVHVAVPVLMIVSGAVGEYDFSTLAGKQPGVTAAEEVNQEVKKLADAVTAALEELGKQEAFEPWECLRESGAGVALNSIDAVLKRLPSIEEADFDLVVEHALPGELVHIKGFGRDCVERYLVAQIRKGR